MPNQLLETLRQPLTSLRDYKTFLVKPTIK